jgi:hypothetical protein
MWDSWARRGDPITNYLSGGLRINPGLAVVAVDNSVFSPALCCQQPGICKF